MKIGAAFLAVVALLFPLKLAWADSPATQPTAQPTTEPTVAAAGTQAAIVELSDEIDDYNRDSFFQRFQKAKDNGAKVIIIDLDTYGGVLTSGLDISRFIKRQTDVHTIAYVKDKAISAGAMIAMACDEIVMSSSATLGDCAPIVFGPDNQLENLSPAERAKAESPVLVDFTESAQRNHHDLLLSQAMVSVQISVYWVQSPTGERKFVDADDYKTLTAAGWKNVQGAAVPVDSDTTLLTVDSEHAVLYGLATGPVDSAEALAQEHGWPVTEYRIGEGDQIVEILGSWPVRMMLLIIFLSSVNVVLHAPGHGVAEVVGLVALLLMLGVPLLTGYAQWWEILLIFLGLGLVAIEILLPGHILPGVTGALMVLGGMVMTFVPKEPSGTPGIFPSMESTYAALERGLMVVVGGMACAMVIWFIMNRFLPKAPFFNRLILTATSGGTVGPLPRGSVSTRVWPAVGSIGRAVSELKPGGTAEFFDESISARRAAAVVSDSGFVEPGAAIIVQEVAGSRIVVRKGPGPASSASSAA